jgi:hypothetical protein
MLTSVLSPLSATASTLPKCPTVAKIVPTPKAAIPTLTKYVTNQLRNEIKTINPQAMFKSGPQWSVGFHYCYYTNPKIKSGYGGFLPSGVKSGYEVSIELKNPSLSGGTTMFLEFAKVGNTWKVLSGGSGP